MEKFSSQTTSILSVAVGGTSHATAMPQRPRDPGSGALPGGDLQSTQVLIARIQGGDPQARERLLARFLPALRRWAHGQLPSYARDLLDTDDLVQVTLSSALERIGEFRPRGRGSFLAYLRSALRNRVRDEIRRVRAMPGREPLAEGLPHGGPSPLEEAIGREAFEAYEAALASLPAEPQEAVILRIEMGLSYAEVAQALGSPSADAARMLVARALVHLASRMEVRDGGT